MIDFNQQYILENDRVRLSPLEEGDIDKLIHFSVYETELWKYSLLQANSPEKMKTYIQLALEGRKNKHSYPFSVFDKQKNAYAGSTRLYDIQIDNASLQIGYTWYGKEFQGTGVNKNCKYLLLEFAFDRLKMERVECRADNENRRSIHAMKSIGFSVEGVLRSNSYKPDGTRRDSIVLSMLKAEWNNAIKNKLKESISLL